MIIKTIHQKIDYSIDTEKVIDISIPYNFNGKQPNFYDVEKGKLSPLKTGSELWSVADGAGCNVPEISMNIHCSGTHTESVGHLLKKTGDIGKMLKDGFIPTVLITVTPELFGKTHEIYHCDVNASESIITAIMIKTQLEKWKNLHPLALIIRTLPNKKEKQFLRFNETPPPFFTNNALTAICDSGVHHLIVDLPSVDRMSDGGILGNHRIFWCDGQNPNGEVNSESQKTITELAYIPNSVEDGFHFMDIQIPHFVCDAAPSRPLLYKPE